MAKVFIIDNNIEFIQKLSTRLEAEKFFDVSRTADNGKDGLNLISKYRGSIDILIIDLMLPIYDGLKVITEINKTNKNKIKNIIVTSTIFTPEAINILNRECVSYTLLKPFDLDTLVETMYSVIEAKNVLSVKKNVETFEKIVNNEKENRITNEQYIFKIKVEREVCKILKELGVPASLKGYSYIRLAILEMFYDSNLIGRVSKAIYPFIAKSFNSTTSRVERAMRHAIDISWNRGNIDVINEIFGYSIDFDKGKPTNSEFISMIADNLKTRLDITVTGNLVKI